MGTPLRNFDKPLFDQVTIIGLGLIGGSLGMALRRARLARRVIGFSRRETTIRRAKSHGVIDDGDTELCPDWLGQSDLVVIATPPLAVVPMAQQVARLTRHSFVLTDVASTKGQIVGALEKKLPSRILFAGSHPMAGSEKSGIGAAEARLFQGATCVVTRSPRTPRRAITVVSALWKGVGGRTTVLTPALHDDWVAQVSHLPHLAAVALTGTPEPGAMGLAAGGFTDMTRIALSDPALWEEICRTNAPEIIRALDRFIHRMEQFRGLVNRKERAGLRRLLQAAQRRRQHLSSGRG